VSDDESAAVVRDFYAAFSAPDHEAAVAAFLDIGVIWKVAGSNPLAGEFVGADAVLAAMRAFGTHSNHTLQLDTKSILASGEHVVAIREATAHTDGLDYAAHEVDVFHVRGGRITQFWSFSEDQAATDALWSWTRR
jgi:ketosteroid isomerase-like protein